MWEKIKAFLNQEWIKVLAWILWILATVLLILQNVTKTDIGKALDYVVVIIEAVGILIAFIKSLLQKKNTTNK